MKVNDEYQNWYRSTNWALVEVREISESLEMVWFYQRWRENPGSIESYAFGPGFGEIPDGVRKAPNFFADGKWCTVWVFA